MTSKERLLGAQGMWFISLVGWFKKNGVAKSKLHAIIDKFYAKEKEDGQLTFDFE